jgi:hypothetical protein
MHRVIWPVAKWKAVVVVCLLRIVVGANLVHPERNWGFRLVLHAKRRAQIIWKGCSVRQQLLLGESISMAWLTYATIRNAELQVHAKQITLVALYKRSSSSSMKRDSKFLLSTKWSKI